MAIVGIVRRGLSAAICAAFLWAAMVLPLAPAHAQDDGLGASYLTPFPEEDTYNLRFVGDWIGDGVLAALAETQFREGRVAVNRRRWALTRLTRADFEAELKQLRADLLAEKAHIAVVMLGPQEARSLREPGARRTSPQAGDWRSEWGRRVDRVMKELKRGGVAVYWVGLPTLRRAEANEEAQMANEIVRQRAYLNGVRFIDIMPAFSDEQGGFSPYGPDLAGKIGLLRGRDGVSFSAAGSTKVAHYVERELRRDLAQAKAERSIPLAGSESEQKRIAPDAPGDAAAGGRPDAGSPAGSAPAGRDKGAGIAGLVTPGGRGGEQPADHGRINLKSVGPNGREQLLAVDILRPAIPASIVALVTRNQNESRPMTLGDTLVDQIPGGVVIMSTITPIGDAGNATSARLSPAQAPYFRVLVKGERPQSRPGRADDFTWPPPPPPVIAAPEDADAAGRQEGVPLPAASPFRRKA